MVFLSSIFHSSPAHWITSPPLIGQIPLIRNHFPPLTEPEFPCMILIMLMIILITINMIMKGRKNAARELDWLLALVCPALFLLGLLRGLRRLCAEQGKAYVITPAQWGILSFLAREREQTISALAQRLGFDAPAVTNIVQRLEQNGLVERVRDREDQRIVKVSLSEEGQQIMRSLQLVVEEFNEQLLPGPQRQAFMGELQRFFARVSTLMPESAGRFGFIREHLGYGEREKLLKRKENADDI
jgi:DNA-binding MarR family transcriptional regulator